MSALANTGNGVGRERYDFSRIKTAIRISNGITTAAKPDFKLSPNDGEVDFEGVFITKV